VSFDGSLDPFEVLWHIQVCQSLRRPGDASRFVAVTLDDMLAATLSFRYFQFGKERSIV
jgi:hypothetical protein